MGSVLLQRSLDATQVSTEALAVLEAGAPYHLIKNDVECNSDDNKMGKKKASVAECAQAVKARGGHFFIYGKGRKAGKCFKENTDSADCPEGWDDDKYDFYEIEGFPTEAPYRLVKSDNECRSKDKNMRMGDKASVEKCALAVKVAGGHFFIYGKGKKAGRCYKENTESADCSEGWEDDYYDFYELEAEKF